MRILSVATVTAAILLAGCKPDAPKLPTLPAAFATLPLPPEPEFIGQSGSEDALMFTFRSSVGPDTIKSYYTRLFGRDTAYHVVSSNAGGAGEHAFYVEIRGRPLWIRIRPEAGNQGSIIELTGAVVATPGPASRDTTSAAATPAGQSAGSSMSSKRSQRR